MPTRSKDGRGPNARIQTAVDAARATKKLDLTMKMLTVVPSKAFTVLNLTHLVLTSNQIGQLPPHIAKLRNLRSLLLTWNNLVLLPPEIGELVRLEKLDVGFNKLVNLPKEIGKLRKLRSLVANDNKLMSLPDELGKCESLTEATFQYNRLEKLPLGMGSLTTLTSLNLAGNNWTEPPSEVVFSGIPYILQYLRHAAAGGSYQRRRRRSSVDRSASGGGGGVAPGTNRAGGGHGSGGSAAGGTDGPSIVGDALWTNSLAAQHGSSPPRAANAPVSSPHERPRSSLSQEVYRYDHAADRAFLQSADPAAILSRAAAAGAAAGAASVAAANAQRRSSSPARSPRGAASGAGGGVSRVRGFSPLRGGRGGEPLGAAGSGGGLPLSQAVASTAHRAVPFPRALMRPGLVPPGLTTVSSAARSNAGLASQVANPQLRPRARERGAGAPGAAGGSSSFAAAMGRLTAGQGRSGSRRAHHDEDARIVADLLAQHGSDPRAIGMLQSVLQETHLDDTLGAAPSGPGRAQRAARGSHGRGSASARRAEHDGEGGGRGLPRTRSNRSNSSVERSTGSHPPRRGSSEGGSRDFANIAVDGRHTAVHGARHTAVRAPQRGSGSHGAAGADGARSGSAAARPGSATRRRRRDSGTGTGNVYHRQGRRSSVSSDDGGDRGAAQHSTPAQPVRGSPAREPKSSSRVRAAAAAPAPANLGATAASIKTMNPETDCCVCFEGAKDTLIAPCGHVCCCNRCATRLHTRKDPCPVCRGPIQGIFKVFNV